MEMVTQAEYARRRGVSRQAISKAVANLGIPKDEKGRIDMVEADRLRGENRDPSQTFVRPGAPVPEAPVTEGSVPPAETGAQASYTTSRAEREYYQSQTAKLEYQRRLGQLLPRELVVDAMTHAGMEIARALDALPLLADELTSAALDGGANAVRQLLRQRAREIRTTVAGAIALPDGESADTLEQEAQDVDT